MRAHLLVTDRLDTWKTAVEYHLIHAVVLLLIAWCRPESVWIYRLFAVGILVFSGTLYLLCLLGWSWLGAVTPVGGLLLLAGWAGLAVSGWSANRNSALK